MNIPQGDQRIARLEAFLQQHPDGPESHRVLQKLIDSHIDRGDVDPARLDPLLERLAARGSPLGFSTIPEHLLESYYLKHDFPPEMSERMLGRVRRDLTEERKAIAAQPDPRRRDDLLQQWDVRELKVSIAEARVLVARKDYAGVIHKLREVEANDSRIGSVSLTRVDPRGKVVGRYPSGGLDSDRLHLALATAYARTGRRKEALASLERVLDFMPERYPEISRQVDALREELDAPAPPQREVRAAPALTADFRFKDLQGRQVALSDFRGRVVLVYFWATW